MRRPSEKRRCCFATRRVTTITRMLRTPGATWATTTIPSVGPRLETGRKQDDWFYLAALRKAGAAAMDRWRTSPDRGRSRPELWRCLWKTAGCEEGQDLGRCVQETHASWLMDSSTFSRACWPRTNGSGPSRRRAGLGHALAGCSGRTAGLEDRTLAVSVTITNRGVAPFYADWPIQVMAIGDGSSGRKFSGDLEQGDAGFC